MFYHSCHFITVVVCGPDSQQQAEQASEEGNKSLQDKAKEGAGQMTASIRDAYQDVKASAQS